MCKHVPRIAANGQPRMAARPIEKMASLLVGVLSQAAKASRTRYMLKVEGRKLVTLRNMPALVSDAAR